MSNTKDRITDDDTATKKEIGMDGRSDGKMSIYSLYNNEEDDI